MKTRKFLLPLALAVALCVPVRAAGTAPCGGAGRTVPCWTEGNCGTVFWSGETVCGGTEEACGVGQLSQLPDFSTAEEVLRYLARNRKGTLPFFSGGAAVPDVPEVPDTPEVPDRTEVPGAADSGASAVEAEAVRIINGYRAQYGLDPLTIDPDLTRGARMKSQDMRDNRYFAHESPTYGTPFQMMKSLGISYRAAAENIAYGYPTPQAVADGWMNSAGHRANILNAAYTRTGIGYVADGNYWTQWFAG